MERIPYRRGAFRLWTALRRERQPDEDELWAQACEWFAYCYRESDAAPPSSATVHGRWAATPCGLLPPTSQMARWRTEHAAI